MSNVQCPMSDVQCGKLRPLDIGHSKRRGADLSEGHEHIDLRELAREAMLERGLEPDFPPEALREVAGMAEPATLTTVVDASIRDMRNLAWASIDNDDS